MKSLFTVISFTIKDMVKRKSFIISNIIILLIIVIGFNVPRFLNSNESISMQKITILDNENVLGETLDSLKENFKEIGYDVQIDIKTTKDEIKEKVEKEEIESALVITENENGIHYEYIINGMGLNTTAPTEIINTISLAYQNQKLSQWGISPDKLQMISNTDNIEITATSSDETSGNIFIMMILSVVLFYAIYFYAYQVSTAITVEKTSRIIETLVTSTSPRIIVLGKTIGIGIVGICQTLVTIAVAIICAKVFLPSDTINLILEMTNLSPVVIVVIAIYYLLGYSLYAMLYALTGSTVSKPEEVQSVNGPIAILAVIGFYLSYFTMMNPTSSLNEIAALVPISSPFCMPFRVMMGLSSINEIILSVLILIITILLVAHISIKIYSSAILNYGEKISLKKMFKMYKSKD